MRRSPPSRSTTDAGDRGPLEVPDLPGGQRCVLPGRRARESAVAFLGILPLDHCPASWQVGQPERTRPRGCPALDHGYAISSSPTDSRSTAWSRSRLPLSLAGPMTVAAVEVRPAAGASAPACVPVEVWERRCPGSRAELVELQFRGRVPERHPMNWLPSRSHLARFVPRSVLIG